MGKNKQKTPQKNSPAASKEAARADNLKHYIAFAFLAAAVSLAYSNSLHGTWAFDDTAIGKFASIEKDLNLRLAYRKITFLSFLINKWIDPFSVVNYRVFNIVLHIINSILVYWIAFVTLNLPLMREKFGRYSFPTALFTGAVFALHPININAVAYIVQRMTSLSAMFTLLALISYIYGRTSSGNRWSVPLYIGAAVFVFLGIFSKENAVMALPLVALYDYFFIAGFKISGLKRKLAIGLSAVIIAFAVSSIFLDAFRIAGDLLGIFLGMNQEIPPKLWTAADVYWTPLQHIMTEFRVIGRYLVLLLLPLPGLLVFDRWGMTLSSGITEPLSTLFSFLVLAGLMIFSVIKARKMPFISFGILWYLIALSLESFIAVGSDLYFEHRNYLPVAGLFFGVAAQTLTLFKDTVIRGKALWAAVLIVSVLLGGLTFRRNYVWKDSVTLWGDTVAKEPGNIRALVALGNAYVRSADLAHAGIYFNKALDMSSSEKRVRYFEDAAYSLGMVNLFMGNLAEARKAIDLIEARLPDSYRTGILKGYYSSLEGDTGEALRQLNKALPQTKHLDSVIVCTLLGDTYSRAGDPARAIENYKKAIGLDPSFSAAYYGMGDTYFALKDIKNAEIYIGKTLSLDPSNPLALAQMADILLVKKEPVEKARKYAERAVASSPTFYQPYVTMGTVLILMGQEDASDEYFRKAADRGLRGYLLPFSKARAYLMKGDSRRAGVFLREIAEMPDAPAELRSMIRKELAKP